MSRHFFIPRQENALQLLLHWGNRKILLQLPP
jgi:hypothetical protein